MTRKMPFDPMDSVKPMGEYLPGPFEVGYMIITTIIGIIKYALIKYNGLLRILIINCP